MKKQDWLTSCAVALVVALTLVLAGPKMGWADPTSMVTVPALPSTSMTIPTINAEVSATTTKDPGKGVIVNVALKSPSGAGVTEVPVTITVSRTTMSFEERSMPVPEQLSQVNAIVPVGIDGNGTTDVELPLTWETPAAVAPASALPQQGQIDLKPAITYQMAISSSLGSKAAPAIIAGNVIRGRQQNIGQSIVNSVQNLISR